MNALKLLLAGLLFSLTVVAQEPITYQKPPQEILELIDIERAPSVIADANKPKHAVDLPRSIQIHC